MVSGDLGVSLSKLNFEDDQKVLQEYYRTAAKLNFVIKPFKELQFRTTIFVDLNNPKVSPPWQSDFFYQIGYYNWRNKTFSYGYENYQPNRFEDISDNFFTNLKRGFFFVSYNYVFGNGSNNFFNFDESSQFVVSPFLRVHPEYPDAMNAFGGYFKPVTGANIRFVIWKNFYLETSLLYYPVKESKLPWDPDFTYGFGLFDWRAFKFNLSYGNWIANRFPWNEKKLEDHEFMNGEFSLSFTYSL